MKNKKITTTKTSTWYKVQSGEDSIWANVQHDSGLMTIGNHSLLRTDPQDERGLRFMFKNSDPKTIETVAKLLLEASKLARTNEE